MKDLVTKYFFIWLGGALALTFISMIIESSESFIVGCLWGYIVFSLYDKENKK